MLSWGVGVTKPFRPGSIASIYTFGRDFVIYSYLCAWGNYKATGWDSYGLKLERV